MKVLYRRIEFGVHVELGSLAKELQESQFAISKLALRYYVLGGLHFLV